MKLLLKQRLFSWLDSYDVYDKDGNTVFIVKGKLSFGHCLIVYDTNGNELAMLKERVMTFLPRFDIFIGGREVGCITKEFTFFHPKFSIDFNGWWVEGDIFGWNYSVIGDGRTVMTVTKDVFHLTDHYVLNIPDSENALQGLLLALAIDAQKCSAESGSTSLFD